MLRPKFNKRILRINFIYVILPAIMSPHMVIDLWSIAYLSSAPGPLRVFWWTMAMVGSAASRET